MTKRRPGPQPERRPEDSVATAAKPPLPILAAECRSGTDNLAAPRVVPLPLSWARQLVENADGPVPEYGSREWLTLPDDSREKVAATVVAAERWRTRNYQQAEVYAFPPSKRAREI